VGWFSQKNFVIAKTTSKSFSFKNIEPFARKKRAEIDEEIREDK
jgi:hypothetical protein